MENSGLFVRGPVRPCAGPNGSVSDGILTARRGFLVAGVCLLHLPYLATSLAHGVPQHVSGVMKIGAIAN